MSSARGSKAEAFKRGRRLQRVIDNLPEGRYVLRVQGQGGQRLVVG